MVGQDQPDRSVQTHFSSSSSETISDLGLSLSSDPTAYQNEAATVRFPLTAQTYNNPQAIWTQVAADLKANPGSGTPATGTGTASGSSPTGGSGSSSGASSRMRSPSSWLALAAVLGVALFA